MMERQNTIVRTLQGRNRFFRPTSFIKHSFGRPFPLRLPVLRSRPPNRHRSRAKQDGMEEEKCQKNASNSFFFRSTSSYCQLRWGDQVYHRLRLFLRQKPNIPPGPETSGGWLREGRRKKRRKKEKTFFRERMRGTSHRVHCHGGREEKA